MRNQLFSVAAILFSTLVLLIGNGLLGTLIPVRAHLEGFSTLAIGVVGSAYFAGFVAGCFTGPRLLARVGHKSTFAVAAGLVTASTLLQSMFMNETVWILTRALFGFASASMFMVLESWLNDRASNATSTISNSAPAPATNHHQCPASQPFAALGVAELDGVFWPGISRPDSADAKFAGCVVKVFFVLFQAI